MAKIKVLSQHLVNKIAAGEVVERPASVIKEMMENSIDADATRISVEVEDGGKKLIRISDNGCGISSDDLALAFAPHATSKIAGDDNLFAIATFGFRGEALASIASVSHVEIVSRPPDAVEGAKMLISAGQPQPIVPAPAAVGTTITVSKLFFNIPARRKFLRTANTEMGHITEQFTRIALAHTEVQLSLTHNGRNLYDLPADQTLTKRIGELFTPELTDGLFPIQRKDRNVEITGLIGHPQQSRTGTKWQYVFLNGRHIHDRFITHAIREAYRGVLEINRQPIVFLFLRVPFETVDVNVHPAKTEVRFADSNLIHSQVLAAIRDRLLSSDLTVSVRTGNGSIPSGSSNGGSARGSMLPDDRQDRQQHIRQAMADFFKTASKTSTKPIYAPAESAFRTPGQAHTPPVGTQQPPTSAQRPNGPSQTAPSTSPPPLYSQVPAAAEIADNDKAQSGDDLDTAPVMQIHNSYLVTQSNDGLIIIDQHALHERIIYEKLSHQLAQGPLTSQRSLIPEIVDVTTRQMAMIEEQTDILADLGITLEQFGPHSIAIQSFPMLFDKASPGPFVTDLLDLLVEQSGLLTREELIHHVLDMMACKAAVKAGDPLTDSEIRALLQQQHLIQRTATCPHGRPTTISLTLTELEKQFKRT